MEKKLSDLKVGDLVVYYIRGNRRIRSIERITPSGQIVLAGDKDQKFNKYGRLIGGGSWSTTHIGPSTPELIEEVKQEVKNRAINIRFQNVFRDLTVYGKQYPVDELEPIVLSLEKLYNKHFPEKKDERG